uniref:Uncharacterized protein n=1 Tax=Arundo donax TaxID=35708 RepID=A0A0A9BLZ2_ARUDO
MHDVYINRKTLSLPEDGSRDRTVLSYRNNCYQTSRLITYRT